MYYYEVFAADAAYQKPEALTYAFPEKLTSGTVVLIPFGRKQVSGFVGRITGKPEFETKQITSVVPSTLPAKTLALHEWLPSYYPSGSGALTQLFVPSGLGVKSRDQAKPKTHKTKQLPPLTKQQATTLAVMEKTKQRSFLLHGETGSGKTRIYIERARKSLELRRSVLILTPEISLVPQLAGSFNEAFGHTITLHSGLTKATRTKHWRQILSSTEPVIVIGTRSALFAPIKDIGLLVVDEMHEPAYKQEQAPRYQTLRVAAKTAHLHESEIIYGSATPPVVEYFIASETNTPLLRMTETARPAATVKRSLVDLRDTKLFSKHRYVSDQLVAALQERLDKGEQSLLFLNRRGTARLILCQVCGWHADCPRCDTPLTYHADNHHMRCHTCGYRAAPPYSCPTCGSDDIVYRSLGTKAIVEAVQNLFPHARIKRFDTDNLAGEQLSRHFEAVLKGEIDILIGTQMLGKGLDLPKLSLVGIINADTGLGMPDFSSVERSYQLLHQAIGRVGRGHPLASGGGEVIVQTFNPDSSLLQAAAEQDWQKFYEQELAERKAFVFPPYCYLLKISISRKSSAAAEQYANKLRRTIADMKLPVSINEAAPAFYGRSHGLHNWQAVIKAKDRRHLVNIVQNLPKGDYTADLDPTNLL